MGLPYRSIGETSYRSDMELLRLADLILKRESCRTRSETAERWLFERYGIVVTKVGNVGACVGYGLAAEYIGSLGGVVSLANVVVFEVAAVFWL